MEHTHGTQGAHHHDACSSCCGSGVAISAAASADGSWWRNRELQRLGVALAMALLAEILAFVYPDSRAWAAAGMALALIAIALAGTGVFQQGWVSLKRGNLNINALMTVAVTGAFVIGEWPEAAMVMALYSLAEYIEHRSVDRARNAIKGLLDLSPPMAEHRNVAGNWESIAADDVEIGTTVRVRPGERLPLDGRVTAGASAVDQSPITGESMPVEKTPGDEVFAGSVNLHGGLEFQVSAKARDTVLARIIHAVEEAQGSRAPTQRFIDRFARVYTPAVFVLALVAALGGPLLLGHIWLESIYRALVILVIACPCALVISTPVTIVSGLAAGARRGILVKGGIHLEQARKLRVVAVDKTGTLTQGAPKLVAQTYLVDGPERVRAEQIAAGLAGRSDHPISRAITAGLSTQAADIANFTAESGNGVLGEVEGERYVLASHRKIQELGLSTPELDQALHTQESQGQSVSLLVGPSGVMAYFAVADAVRADSAQAIAELKQLGVLPVMLTGDNEVTARNVGAQVGIDTVHASLLPHEKLDALQALKQGGQHAAMVGDGINDAPALASADIGFAMGGAGTHTAMEAADIVVMNDDLRRVPETIRLSRRTYSVLWQNISFALGIKLIFLLLAVSGHATMWMAVFADMGASLLVVFNGLRLLLPQTEKRVAAPVSHVQHPA